MSGSIVKDCNCKSEYQDKKYGKQRRLFTVGGKEKTDLKYTCTVCGRRY